MHSARGKNAPRSDSARMLGAPLLGGQRIDDLLEHYLRGVQRSLETNLFGVYLRGSLAMGDVLESSDIDLFVATERPVSEDETHNLFTFHAELAALAHPYATRLETAYIDRAALKRYEPGQRHLTLGQGEELKWSLHDTNWILERWTLRKHGVTLLGPDAKHLIAPVSAGDLRDAVRVRLGAWVEWANTPNDPDWRLPEHHKAYVVETMCRALYTLKRGEMTTKPKAVWWALTTLSEPWRSTVERSQVWRQREWLEGLTEPEINEVRRFILWVASESEYE